MRFQHVPKSMPNGGEPTKRLVKMAEKGRRATPSFTSLLLATIASTSN